jgi:enoyl-CoA hydratase
MRHADERLGTEDLVDDLIVERAGQVAVIVLNRPDKLNAWTEAMRERLCDVLADLSGDSAVRAVVLTGAGERAFCAGQDLAETRDFIAGDHARAERWIDRVEVLYRRFRDLEVPLVAALNGVAAGSGFQVALLADLRIAHIGVRLGQPEVRHGIPSITGTWLIREALGASRTSELVLSGRLMSAEEAHAVGVIHVLVDAGAVREVAIRRAAELAALPPGAVRETKGWLRQLDAAAFEEAFRVAREVHRRSYASGEPQAMMERFLTAHQNDRAR